jgi:hypothetical protein
VLSRVIKFRDFSFTSVVIINFQQTQQPEVSIEGFVGWNPVDPQQASFSEGRRFNGSPES